MSENTNHKKVSPWFVLPFFLALAALTVVSFLIPLRPARSQMEKRELARFPEFSWQALSSGDYFDGISLWFSDTFPGREGWIDLSTRVSALHGSSEIAIEGQIPEAQVAVPPVIPENRQTPEKPLPAQTQPQEDEPAETTAPPESWGGLEIHDQGEIQLGAVIQIGDTAFNYQGFSQIFSDEYAASLSYLQELVKDQGVRVVSAPAPTSVGIMVEKQFLEQMKCADQNEIISYMHGKLRNGVVPVDTYDALIHHNDEYLFFKTDHHWTALGAYYSYRAICQSLGYEPAELDSFRIMDQGKFRGSLCYKSPRPQKLSDDQVLAYKPQGDIVMTVYQGENAGLNPNSGTVRPLLRDMSDQPMDTKYLTFIWSDNPLTVITNNSLPDAPDCILVKDSFGNCLAPFLTQNYHNVIAVDYRKYYTMRLPELAEKYQVEDIIFAPYLTATQSQDGNHCFRRLCAVDIK